MPGGPLSEVIRYLRRVADPGGAAEASDEQLLERFVSLRDESAFEALMARHGPMVLGVCRRILRDAHDADDAFQATFLVLAHKARSIGRPQALGSWLYRIAQRTAVRAKMERNRRRAQESIVEDLPAAEAVEDLAWHELRPVLDEEINRLPRKYRDAIVHCYLQEKTYTEAAKILGLAAGTLSSRLAQARDLLRKRLLRRGLALSSSLLATSLAQQALSAAVPGALRTITTQAALRIAAGQTILAGLATEPVAALTKEVLKAMFVTKIRLTGLGLLTAGIIAAGAGVLAHGVLAEKQIGTPTAETLPAVPPGAAAAPLPPGQNPPQERFENAFGYTWILSPRKIVPEDDNSLFHLKWNRDNPGRGICSVSGTSRSRDGFMWMVDLDEDKTVLFTMVTGGSDLKSTPKYRPVVFDAQRKRYLPDFLHGGSVGCGPNVCVRMSRYTLTTKTLPVEKIRYCGVEQLTVEGRKAIADRAQANGIEVLPPPPWPSLRLHPHRTGRQESPRPRPERQSHLNCYLGSELPPGDYTEIETTLRPVSQKWIGDHRSQLG